MLVRLGFVGKEEIRNPLQCVECTNSQAGIRGETRKSASVTILNLVWNARLIRRGNKKFGIRYNTELRVECTTTQAGIRGEARKIGIRNNTELSVECTVGQAEIRWETRNSESVTMLNLGPNALFPE